MVKIIFDGDVRDRFKVREQLKDGRLSLFLEPIPGAVKQGDRISFRVGLTDPAMAAPVFSETVTLRIVDEQKEQKKDGKAKNNGAASGDKQTGEGDRKPTRGLPPYKLLTKDGREVNDRATEAWPDGFTEYDGGDVRDIGGGSFVYLINYDNAYHLKYRLKERGDVARDVVTEKFILGMRIVMLGFEHALREKLKRGAEASAMAEAVDDMRLVLARTAASTVLALAENLPKIIDASSVRKDEVE